MALTLLLLPWSASSAKAADVSFGLMDLNVGRPSRRCATAANKVDALQDLSSVSAFAASYSHPTLDLLICNAGIMNTPFALSKVNRCPFVYNLDPHCNAATHIAFPHVQDGIEAQYQSNHLGHFKLVTSPLTTMHPSCDLAVVL